MIQARIDRMHPTDQVVIKTAAVLGKHFPLEMLYVTVPPNVSHAKINNSLVRLTRNRIVECDSLVSSGVDPNDKYKMVKFVTSDFQEIAYDMFLENVRVPLHIKAAQYLEQVEVLYLSHTFYACIRYSIFFLNCIYTGRSFTRGRESI